MIDFIDVCICTHNPRPEIFQVILKSLTKQTLDKKSYHVWIIDNLSEPAITDESLLTLAAENVSYTILRESRLGLVYARQCAIESTNKDLLVFVDDDNELADNYLEIALEIAQNNPDIGCFGGKLLPGIKDIPRYVQPLLPYLAIEDKGNEVLVGCTNYWGPWEPPGAGAVIRRSVLEYYVQKLNASPEVASLGHKGSKGILSCDDSFLMRCAYYLHLKCSYQPRLSLIHHIAPKRITTPYLLKLLHGYGRSYVILERLLGRNFEPIPWKQSIKQIVENHRYRKTQSWLQSLCMIAWDVGYIMEVGIAKQPPSSAKIQDTSTSLPETIRTPLSEYAKLKRLKKIFPRSWEFFRKIALTFKIIH